MRSGLAEPVEILSWQKQKPEKVLNLMVKAAKCQFWMKLCMYLGHVVGNRMVQPEESKVKAVKSFPKPEMKHQV